MNISEVSVLAQRLSEDVGRVIVGGKSTVELAIVSLLAEGHVLLEDVPGTGKTMLAKSLAASLGGDFKRIQFTPDLLPSDVIGASIFNQKEGAFEFRKGPAFTSILLADEINRATPRTQSALLECMEERQITNDGVTYPLDEPFFVIATQNPVEIQGTFPLPEAQLDRFLMRLSMGYPSKEDSISVLDRFTKASPLDTLSSVAQPAEILDARKAVKEVYVSRDVAGYIVSLAEATRTYPDVSLGVSTRGMLALMKACQARAAVYGRDFITPDDVKTLVFCVFAHRIITRANPMNRASRLQAILSEILGKVPAPTEDITRDSKDSDRS